MIFARSDIPFASDDTHRFLPWLIGAMVCLAALFLCLGVTINGWIIERHSNYTGSFTVNVPAGITDMPAKLDKIRDALKRTPGVENVTQLNDHQVAELLKPWLGSDSLEGLPVPAVFDIALQKSAPHSLDYTQLEKTLAMIVPGTQVDAHERWVAAFSDFSATAQCLMLLLALLIFASMGAMIAFTSRASLKMHSKTVHLLHSIGAEDRYIAEQFQYEAFMLTLEGAIMGCVLAGFLYWGMGFYAASLPASVMPSLAMRGTHLILLLIMPPACAFAAWSLARWSVRRQLQEHL